MDIVLIVGGVESLVVIIVDVRAGLYQQIGFEHEVAPFGGNGESLLAGQGYDTVFRILFILCLRRQRQKQQGGY